MGGQAGTISVVMPAHDEEPFLEASVRTVAAGLAERERPYEVLVVENGSTDGTAALARRLEDAVAHVKAVSLPDPDYGRALRAGFGLAVSDTHGMKVLRRLPLVALAEECRLGTDLFDTELVLRAQRARFVVTEIPVRVSETRPSRTSILGRIPRTLLGLARLRLLLWTERTAPSPP